MSDVMKQIFVEHLEKRKNSHPELYAELIIEKFGKEVEWKEIISMEKFEIYHLEHELGHRIKLHESPIDVRKMVIAIQHSRHDGGALQAFTKFHCAFCGKEEEWPNSAVPNICTPCATTMATNIAKRPNIFKEKENEKTV